MRKFLLDTSRELILHHYKEGILLVRPDETAVVRKSPAISVASLLNFPICIAFLNQQSEVQNINEYNATAWGYNSPRVIMGKTISSAYKSKSADFSLKHDQAVVKHQKMLIKTEQCERTDSTRFTAITTKIPWYDNDYKVIGILAFAITLELPSVPSIQYSLLAFSQLGLLTSQEKSFYTACLATSNMNFSPRERDIIKYLVRGKTIKSISYLYNISPRTVETHYNNIKNKLGVYSKEQLIEKLIDLKLM